MVAKRIEAIDTNPDKPWGSTAKFADGTSFYGPTEHIQQAYEQQRQAERLSMLASNSNHADLLGADPSRAAAFLSNQQNAPVTAASPVGSHSAPPAQAAPVQAPQQQSQMRPTMVSNESAQPDNGSGAYNARDFAQGANALGVNERDAQAYRAYQQIGGTADMPTFLAGKKTVSSPGRAAVNKDTEANQLLWRTNKATTVEGAKPVDEDRWNNVQDLSRKAVEAQAQAQIAEGTAATDTARAQALAAQQLHDQMAQQQARDESNFQARYNNMLGEVEKAGNRQVDPQRWFSQHGAVGSMMAILGSAMIQAANLRNGGPAGPNMLQQFIEQDINAQSRDLDRRGHQANNMLASLSQQWGSVEAGKAALRSSQLRLADSQLAEIAANGRSKAMQQQALALRAQTEKQIAQADYDLHAAAQGVRTEREQGQYTSPQRAVAGGSRTTYDMGAINKGARENTELDLKGRAKENQGEHSTAGRAERLGKSLGELDEAREATEAYYKSVGLQRDPQSGKWVQAADHPLNGPLDTAANAVLPPALMSDAANDAIAKRNAAVEAYGRARSGAAISDAEWASFNKQIAGTGAGNSASAANALDDALRTKARDIRAGAGPEANQIYEEGLRRENERTVRSKTNDAAITPYRPEAR